MSGRIERLRSALFAWCVVGTIAFTASAWGQGSLPTQSELVEGDSDTIGSPFYHSARFTHHAHNNPSSPLRDDAAEAELIPSLLDGVTEPESWWEFKRPEIQRRWLQVLGKVEPDDRDARWFGDVCQARIKEITETWSYTRIELELPIEKDFYQPHALLIPKGQGRGPFPAVIAWTSSEPDYRAPEGWWGAWLASRGYVVLTGWSFILNYRDGTHYGSGAHEKVYERFGHWLPMGKMVHDVRREAEFLRCREEVDAARIGFMGLSLGAKAAVYVAAFAPEIAATVSIDPHIALNGGTNWYEPWYLDWTRVFNDIPTLEGTPLSLLNSDPKRPGFEHDHHEVLALAAPRPFLLIGGSLDEDGGGDSDDLQSWGYVNRAKEVYRLLGVEDRLQYVPTGDGHAPGGPNIDPAWQAWFERWLRQRDPSQPIEETYFGSEA